MKRNIFKRRQKHDVIELKESFYCCSINGSFLEFKTKQAMLNYIEDYSSKNTIFNLAMFRTDMFNLIK